MLKGFKELKKKNKILFTIIIAFAIISFWRGAWGLLDELLFPNNELISYLTSIVIGVSLLLMTNYVTKGLI
ncbi:MAG: hypothetical protein WC307_02580 [Candidatus Nanoarchaeia archaeon]|jgi:hypothetical protein